MHDVYVSCMQVNDKRGDIKKSPSKTKQIAQYYKKVQNDQN